MIKTFKAEDLDFLTRFKKESKLVIFMLLVILLLSIINYRQIFDFKVILFAIIIFLLLFFIAYRNAKDYVSEVILSKERIVLKGKTANSNWINELELKETSMKFRSISNGRGNFEYLLVISSPSNKFEINSLYNWEYQNLVDLFESFKTYKNEKIILDEKFVLDKIEEKIRKKNVC